jgi:hypothetical protein
MAWIRKVNRHVQVLKFIELGAIDTIRVRPGTITALGAGELVTVRVGHSGETYVNIDRRTDVNENQTVTKYIPP